MFWNFYSPLALDATAGHGGLDISRTADGYVVEIPVAGFKPEQIDITYKDNVLSVSGTNERRTFTRSLMLPDEIDSDDVDAHVAEAEPKRIQINTT